MRTIVMITTATTHNMIITITFNVMNNAHTTTIRELKITTQHPTGDQSMQGS